MFVKKHKQSINRSIRMSRSMYDFLKHISSMKRDVTANDFIVNLIEDTKEYQDFMKHYQADDKTPSLFAQFFFSFPLIDLGFLGGTPKERVFVGN